ncbi:MAG: hypothetical protein FJ145_21880 [Deltaproteobacteria bacterium]|nr:hypothetical protein [Deltaproteobacteria bacterium]
MKGQDSDYETKELFPFLRAYIRQANLRRETVQLTADNWRTFALAHEDVPFVEKSEKLLDLIMRRSKPGEPANVTPWKDLSLVDAQTEAELNFLLQHLVELDFIKHAGGFDYTLRPKAWERLQAKPVGGTPGRCFVAMWFDESMNAAYDDGVYPAVKLDCGMEPVRIDLLPHNDNIVDKIIVEIRKCQFMIADFTGHRGGVYFEAGFAKGLGREVIWTCREDDFENIHFDIAQFSHIVWKTPSELRSRLANRIRATIRGVA